MMISEYVLTSKLQYIAKSRQIITLFLVLKTYLLEGMEAGYFVLSIPLIAIQTFSVRKEQYPVNRLIFGVMVAPGVEHKVMNGWHRCSMTEVFWGES